MKKYISYGLSVVKITLKYILCAFSLSLLSAPSDDVEKYGVPLIYGQAIHKMAVTTP